MCVRRRSYVWSWLIKLWKEKTLLKGMRIDSYSSCDSLETVVVAVAADETAVCVRILCGEN